MGFSLYTLFQAGLLCLNAICILNEERFLSKIGWSTQHGGFGEDPGMKIQVRQGKIRLRDPLPRRRYVDISTSYLGKYDSVGSVSFQVIVALYDNSFYFRLNL